MNKSQFDDFCIHLRGHVSQSNESSEKIWESVFGLASRKCFLFSRGKTWVPNRSGNVINYNGFQNGLPIPSAIIEKLKSAPFLNDIFPLDWSLDIEQLVSKLESTVV